MGWYDTPNQFNPENRFVGDIEDGKSYPYDCYTKEESDDRYAQKSAETDISALAAEITTKAAETEVQALSEVVEGKANESEIEAARVSTSGTTYEFLADRLDSMENIITPEMYGAVGDGVTDDSIAIQNALNNNDNVFFKAKSYLLERPINLNSNNKLWLCGSELHFVVSNRNTPSINVHNCSDIIISDGKIRSNGSDNNVSDQGAGIHVYYADNVILNNIEICDSYGDNLYINNSTVYTYNMRLGKFGRNNISPVCGTLRSYNTVIYAGAFVGANPGAEIDIEPNNSTDLVDIYFFGLYKPQGTFNIFDAYNDTTSNIKVTLDSCYLGGYRQILIKGSNKIDFSNILITNCTITGHTAFVLDKTKNFKVEGNVDGEIKMTDCENITINGVDIANIYATGCKNISVLNCRNARFFSVEIEGLYISNCELHHVASWATTKGLKLNNVIYKINRAKTENSFILPIGNYTLTYNYFTNNRIETCDFGQGGCRCDIVEEQEVAYAALYSLMHSEESGHTISATITDNLVEFTFDTSYNAGVLVFRFD